MKYSILYVIFLFFISTGAAKGQAAVNDSPHVLEKLFGRLLTDYNDSDRVRINDSIKFIIDSYVESDTVFDHRFSNLRYLGQVTSTDSRIKIITWNLIFQDGTNKYFCYFLRKGDRGKKNIIYRLTGIHSNEPLRSDTTYSAHNWYGALYYDIKPFKTDKKVYYILLGVDYGNSSVNRKIIEVISFSHDGELVFGKKCFIAGNQEKFREVLEYSSGGVMSLRFHFGKTVVFDHLVSFSESKKNDREYYGAEYTYDAYIFKKGLWRFSAKFDARNDH